jgi:hypothetical protein
MYRPIGFQAFVQGVLNAEMQRQDALNAALRLGPSTAIERSPYPMKIRGDIHESL